MRGSNVSLLTIVPFPQQGHIRGSIPVSLVKATICPKYALIVLGLKFLDSISSTICSRNFPILFLLSFLQNYSINPKQKYLSMGIPNCPANNGKSQGKILKCLFSKNK
jgi:hypothetical protein